MNNRVSLTNICSFALLIFLIFCQFAMLSGQVADKGDALIGDEGYYVAKAAYLVQHGVLPKVEKGLEKSGWPDYRGPGYPVFIALCNMREFDISNVRRRCAIIQFILMALALIALYLIAAFAMKGSRWIYLVAFILGIQPWAFDHSASLYADSFCTSVTTASLIFLFMFIRAKRGITELVYLIVSSTLLCLAFMIRTEMLILAPAIAATALIIKFMKDRRIFKYALISGLVFFCFFGIQIGYRYYLTGRPELVPKYRFNYVGAWNWAQTWFNTGKFAGEGFAFGSAEKKMENLPAYAFGDDFEKKEIARALSVYKVSGHTEEVDAIFQNVADKRVRDNFFVNCMLTRIWRSANLWLNLETNAQFLNALSSVPHPIRRPILAGFLLLKMLIYLLAAASLFALIKHSRNKSLNSYHYLTMLAMANVILITVFIGLIVGSNEYRQVLKAWPAMLWCAISAIIDLSEKNKHPAQFWRRG